LRCNPVRFSELLALARQATNILAVVDRIMVLSAGQVQAYGTRDKVLSKPPGPRVAPVPVTAAVA
jgi:ABC-type protease/lipase transport system fused ATPase/permease subunit